MVSKKKTKTGAKKCRHRWHFIHKKDIPEEAIKEFGYTLKALVFCATTARFVCDKCGKVKDIKIKYPKIKKEKVKKQEDIPIIIPEDDGELGIEIVSDEEIEKDKYRGL